MAAMNRVSGECQDAVGIQLGGGWYGDGPLATIVCLGIAWLDLKPCSTGFFPAWVSTIRLSYQEPGLLPLAEVSATRFGPVRHPWRCESVPLLGVQPPYSVPMALSRREPAHMSRGIPDESEAVQIHHAAIAATLSRESSFGVV